MTIETDELDRFGKRLFESLRTAPGIDPQAAAQEKAIFLQAGEQLRLSTTAPVEQPSAQKNIPHSLGGKFHLSIVRIVIASLMAAVLLVGSSLTAFAAQESLPGDMLYSLKSFGEDIHLALTFSTRAKLDLNLSYTNRRMGEIERLVARGKGVPAQTSTRLSRELESALELAAQLDDIQMLQELAHIKNLAVSQSMTMKELVTTVPAQEEPSFTHIQRGLDEQVQLSSLGENNPQAFREQIRLRRLRHQKSPNQENGSGNAIPLDLTITPFPGHHGNGAGNSTPQATDIPGQGNPGNGQGGGQGKGTPGGGNH